MKKRNRVLALTVAAAMSASLLAGCGSSAQQGGAASSEAASTDTAASVSDGGEDNIIRVGVVCSMTGGSAIYGEGAHNAVDMAVEKINAGDSGYKIEIVNGGFIDPYQSKMAALFAKDKCFAKVAVIYAKDDDYSNGLKDAFVENCEAKKHTAEILRGMLQCRPLI